MRTAVALSFLLVCSTSRAAVYVIGSSYSNDAMPQFLDDQPQWHIDCGKPLPFIFDNPSVPCESTSTIWPPALSTTRFNYVSFQPVKGAGITEQSDVDVISYWLSLQTTAIAVVHPTWPMQSQWESDFHDNYPDNTLTNNAQLYVYDLIYKLQAANPTRRIMSDRANEILDSIYHDIQNGIGPLTDFEQMFRDEAGHLSAYGNYMAHNTLRQAFGQPTGVELPPYGVPQAVRQYIDSKIRACRPASAVDDRRQDLCDPFACTALSRAP